MEGLMTIRSLTPRQRKCGSSLNRVVFRTDQEEALGGW